MKNKNEFSEQVDNLIREFDNTSDKKLAKQAKGLREEQRKIEKSLSDLQESLDYLRVCIKYLVFDLEATRRENNYLRHLLANPEDGELTD